MPPKADEQLIADYCQGSIGAFDELYRRYRQPTFGFLLRLLRDRGIAEDVFQDLWLQVIEQAPSFRADGKARTWLFTLARSRTYDRLRREAVRRGSGADPRRAEVNGRPANGAGTNPGNAPDAYALLDGAQDDATTYEAAMHQATGHEATGHETSRNDGTDDDGAQPQTHGDAADGHGWAGDGPEDTEDGGLLAARLQAERRQFLDRALGVVPEEQRVVFLLREEGELTLSEVAETLGIPYETARSRYRYALARLRAQFSRAVRRLT